MIRLHLRLILLSVSGLFCFETAAAQSYVDGLLNYKVTAHYPEHTVVAHVKPAGTISVLNDRQYYWFSGSQINITQGGYSGKLLNGDYEDFYMNKNLKESGSFDKGLKTGIWKSWTAAGILKDQSYFKGGRKNGDYVRYDTLGRMVEKGIRHDDLLDGKQEILKGDSTIVIYYKMGKVKQKKKAVIPEFIHKVFPKKSKK